MLKKLLARSAALFRPFNPLLRAWDGKGVHLLLFILTVCTTFLVGLSDGLAGAFWYSGGIMAILLCHEMGHFWTARMHGVPATLPYFIPVPYWPFGTMGAIIKMHGTIPNRRALFDIGAAGPLAGMVLIVPAILLGLDMSQVVERAAASADGFSLGESLLFKILVRLVIGPVGENQDVLLHPLAYAGWVGLLVTAINLLPVGQLDGGHIVYALFKKRSKWVAFIFFAVMAAVCLFLYFGWLLLLVLLTVFRRHPPTMDDQSGLDPKRKALGFFMIAVFILSFTPVPFGFGEGLIPMIREWLR
ncbi:site-2 protease family protein [bacterium]|nr:site-2 protease family protein [bacterium]